MTRRPDHLLQRDIHRTDRVCVVGRTYHGGAVLVAFRDEPKAQECAERMRGEGARVRLATRDEIVEMIEAAQAAESETR